MWNPSLTLAVAVGSAGICRVVGSWVDAYAAMAGHAANISWNSDPTALGTHGQKSPAIASSSVVQAVLSHASTGARRSVVVSSHDISGNRAARGGAGWEQDQEQELEETVADYVHAVHVS